MEDPHDLIGNASANGGFSPGGKPELRGFWGDSLAKPPFKVTVPGGKGRYNLPRCMDYLPTFTINSSQISW